MGRPDQIALDLTDSAVDRYGRQPAAHLGNRGLQATGVETVRLVVAVDHGPGELRGDVTAARRDDVRAEVAGELGPPRVRAPPVGQHHGV